MAGLYSSNPRGTLLSAILPCQLLIAHLDSLRVTVRVQLRLDPQSLTGPHMPANPTPTVARPARQRSFPRTPIATARSHASYTAAAYARTLDLAEKHAVNLEGLLTWAFEFEDQPSFTGFRVLATGGIDLPVLNVFRMLGLLGGRRMKVESGADAGVETLRLHGVSQGPEIMALAGLEDRTLGVLVWHYHDDDLPGPDAAVELCLRSLPAQAGSVLVRHYRIDRDHGNAFEAWKRMGSPPQPTSQQLAALKRSARLGAITNPCWQRPQAARSHSSSPCRGRPSRWSRRGGESRGEGEGELLVKNGRMNENSSTLQRMNQRRRNSQSERPLSGAYSADQ